MKYIITSISFFVLTFSAFSKNIIYFNYKNTIVTAVHDKDLIINESCFKINLPYSVEMPDSSIITINNVDDRKKIEDWYENNPKNETRHKLIYPVS